MSVLKGSSFEDRFYSEINLRNVSYGIESSVTAFAPTSELARKAALLFFGQMLDTLAIGINQSVYLSLTERRPSQSDSYNTRRIIEDAEWKAAFKEARLLAFSESTFLRALGWYRKGLYTEDPFDKFLAFWNSVEVVTSKYHPPIPEGREKRSKSQMWESFKALWGETCEQWPVITGNDKWIDENYETRKNIAHGVAPINVEEVEKVLSKINIVEKLAYTFLTDWRRNKLKPDIPPGLESF